MEDKVYTMRGNNFPKDKFVQAMDKYVLAELVAVREKEVAGIPVTLYCFEKYFLRNNCYAAVSVLVTEEESATEVDIVTSAGGEGIFNFKWGTHKSLARDTVEVLSKFGFIEETSE